MTIEVNQNELTIVNAMLSCIGDLPVEDLDTAASDADVLKARARLKQLMIDEQTKGWWFNTETWEFTPDGTTGYVTLPSTTLRIRNEEQYIKRGTQLYDVTAHTLVIDEDTIELDLVLLLDYDQLPYSFYKYIKDKARYAFFLEEDGDPQTVQLLGADLRISMMLVQDEDLQFRATNMLTGNPTVNAVFSGWTKRRDS